MSKTYPDLHTCLLSFQDRFNANPRARKLVAKWERAVHLEPLDIGQSETLLIGEGALQEVRAGPPPEGMQVVHLQGEDYLLRQVFALDYNPTNAHLDGLLAIFSDERDKVKLEALAMVVWSLG